MSRLPIALAVAVAAAAAASPALAARATPAGTAVPRGGDVLVIGTGFAPRNEFCTPVRMRVDGRAATLSGQISDSVGGWALRLRATQAPGRHTVTLSQTCENGNTGRRTTVTARAGLRILA